jgi:hypothetical protein
LPPFLRKRNKPSMEKVEELWVFREAETRPRAVSKPFAYIHTIFSMLYLGDGDGRFIRNVGTYLPNNTVSHPGRQ